MRCQPCKKTQVYICTNNDQNCLLCDEPAEQVHPICSSCESELPWLDERCRICALPLPLDGLLCGQCARQRPAFRRVEAPWHYGFPLDALITRFKHQRQWPLGRLMAQMLGNWLAHRFADGLPRPALLLPVPMASRRLRQRGYNQASELTRDLAGALAARYRRGAGGCLLPGAHPATRQCLTWRGGAGNFLPIIVSFRTDPMPLPTPLSQHIVRRPQRIALLQHIDEQGSNTRAAKAAGMSYKAAWDAIDELNNLAARPLVERSTGGRGGGGARLSDEGRRVLRLYQRLQILQAQILEEAEDSSDLDLLGRLMLRTSARNQLHGRVSAIHPQGRNDTIELTLAGDLRIEAQITHDSTHRLELEPGTAVVALIKAGWLELATRDAPVPQGTNSLEATIDEWLDDPQGSSELRLSLGSGQILCAFAEPEWLRSHDLAVGSVVQVRFLPTYVLLGTPV